MTPLPKAAKQRTVSAGTVVAIAVASSFITSTATTWALGRVSAGSAESKTVAAKPSAVANIAAVDFTTRPAAPRKPVNQASIEDIETIAITETDGPPDIGQISADRAANTPAAAGVLDLIKIVRDNSTGYFGGSKHAALNNELRAVERAANGLLQNAGGDAGQSAEALASTIDRAISRLDNISGRETESPEAVQVSLAIKAKLEEIRAGLPQSN